MNLLFLGIAFFFKRFYNSRMLFNIAVVYDFLCLLQIYIVHLFMIAIRKSQVPILGRLSYRIIAVWDLDTLGSGKHSFDCGIPFREHLQLIFLLETELFKWNVTQGFKWKNLNYHSVGLGHAGLWKAKFRLWNFMVGSVSFKIS